MFFYLIQQFNNQDLNGQIIIKNLIFGSLAYLCLHAFLYSDYSSKYPIVKTLRNYFWYLVLIDIVAVAVTYKQIFNKTKQDVSVKKPHKNSLELYKKDIISVNNENIIREIDKDKDLDIFATEENQTESNLTNTEHIDTLSQTFEQESEMRPEGGLESAQDTDSLLDKFRAT
jgi:hypothetical protein